MPAGDSFAGLLNEDDTPPPEVAPLNKERGKLAAAAALVAKGKGLVGPTGGPDPSSTQVMKDAAEAQYWQGEDAKIMARRQAEAGGIHAGEGQRRQDEAMTARFGTADPLKAAQMKATGAFDGDLALRMRIDPEGTKAAVDRATAIHAGNAEGAPKPERTYSVGTGAHGEPYYTNLSRGELHQEQHDAEAISGEKQAPRVTGLHALGIRDLPAGEGAPQSPAEILFQGELGKAQQIAGTPERLDKHAREVEAIGADLLDFKKYPTANEALDTLHEMRASGKLGKSGMTLKEEQGLERQIAHFAKPASQLQDMEPDEAVLYRPWGGTQPGRNADKAEPANLLNPGGAMPVEDMLKQQHAMAIADHASAISEAAPTEAPRTFQYATGQVGLTKGDTESKGPRSDIGRAFSLFNEKRKRRQRESDEAPYDPNAKSDVARIFGF